MDCFTGIFRSRCDWGPGWLLLAILVFGLVGTTEQAVAGELEETLSEVTGEYAKGYCSPFLYSFGPSSNSNMYSTASIPWGRVVFGAGFKVMGTPVNDADKTFSTVISDVDLHAYDPASFPVGTMADIHFSGPTIFGDTEVDGQIEGYVNGISVFTGEAISGLADLDWMPLAAPEFYVGGIAGLRLTVRYLPEVDMGEIGKTKYLGYGLQWNANGVLKNLPVDVMAGFFTQEIDVGSVFETNASTYFVGASKVFSPVTVYGGFAIENSDLEVSYDFIHPDTSVVSPVNFEVEGIQDSRITLGVTLNFMARLNIEAGIGNKMTTYSAGLMFGI